MIQTINAALSRIEEITPELKKYFFTLEKPLGFTPGQFVTIRFKDHPLTWPVCNNSLQRQSSDKVILNSVNPGSRRA